MDQQPGRFEDVTLDVERHKVARLLALLEAEGLGDDDQAIMDAIEGETNALEAVSKVLRQIANDEAYAAALKAVEGQFKGRRDRYEQRVESGRRAVKGFMMEFDIPKIERPEATLTLSAGGAKIGYAGDMDPKKLPEQFQRVTVDADKAAIAKAMKDDPNLNLPGVFRTNGGISLTIRTK